MRQSLRVLAFVHSPDHSSVPRPAIAAGDSEKVLVYVSVSDLVLVIAVGGRRPSAAPECAVWVGDRFLPAVASAAAAADRFQSRRFSFRQQLPPPPPLMYRHFVARCV